MSATEILEQFRKLSPAEQREVAARISEELPANDDDLTAEEIAELDRRVVEIRKYPERGIPWEQIQAELNDRLKSGKE